MIVIHWLGGPPGVVATYGSVEGPRSGRSVIQGDSSRPRPHAPPDGRFQPAQTSVALICDRAVERICEASPWRFTFASAGPNPLSYHSVLLIRLQLTSCARRDAQATWSRAKTSARIPPDAAKPSISPSAIVIDSTIDWSRPPGK